ncbi:MAG: hypothetical protein FWG64_11930 [Firmicutes bacterium]|nr:hypothetical protein [Bacillota bacterium]
MRKWKKKKLVFVPSAEELFRKRIFLFKVNFDNQTSKKHDVYQHFPSFLGLSGYS